MLGKALRGGKGSKRIRKRRNHPKGHKTAPKRKYRIIPTRYCQNQPSLQALVNSSEDGKKGLILAQESPSKTQRCVDLCENVRKAFFDTNLEFHNNERVSPHHSITGDMTPPLVPKSVHGSSLQKIHTLHYGCTQKKKRTVEETLKNCPPKNLDEVGISPGSSSKYLSSVTYDSLKVTTSLGKDQITLDSDDILLTSPESGLGHTDVPSVEVAYHNPCRGSDSSLSGAEPPKSSQGNLDDRRSATSSDAGLDNMTGDILRGAIASGKDPSTCDGGSILAIFPERCLEGAYVEDVETACCGPYSESGSSQLDSDLQSLPEVINLIGISCLIQWRCM